MKHVFIFCLLLIPCSAEFESKLTVAVASRLNYPTTVATLRNDVENFLENLKVEMMLDVQNLRSKNLGYRSIGLMQTDEDLYYLIASRFDREFERISRKFILRAAQLDELNAPLKEKEHFVKSMKQELEHSINALLQSHGQKIAQRSRNR